MITKKLPRDNIILEYIVFNPDAQSTIVLLHGFPQDLDTWMPIAESLANDYRIILPRQRGYGSESVSSALSSYRISVLCQDILAILDVEDITQPVHLVGHDWGGSVAWSVARQHEARVRSAVILSMPEPRALARSFFGIQLVKSWYVALLQLPAIPEKLVEWCEGKAATQLLVSNGLPAAIARRYVRSLKSDGRRPTGAFNWYRAMPFNLREAITRESVMVPVLHIWGTEDAAVARKGIIQSSRWVDSYELTILEGEGHWIPEIHPSSVVSLVRSHVKAHSDD